MRRSGCLILVLLGLLLPAFGREARAQSTAGADTTLGLPEFPRGSLSAEQLAEVAAAIRRLEANPLASDAWEANTSLLAWLIHSPDVTVNVCARMIPAPRENALSSPAAGMQAMLSSAAFIIEHPDRAPDAAAVNLAGLQGALHSYTIIKARHGDRARAASLERLLRLQERGELERHVREQTARCAEPG